MKERMHSSASFDGSRELDGNLMMKGLVFVDNQLFCAGNC